VATTSRPSSTRAIRRSPTATANFIVADPAGVLVDVITEIPPSAEYAANFTAAAGT
jgi:hypothetical protein